MQSTVFRCRRNKWIDIQIHSSVNICLLRVRGSIANRFQKKYHLHWFPHFSSKQTKCLSNKQMRKKMYVKHTFFHWHCERRKKKNTNKSFDKKRSKREMNKTIYDEIIIVLALYYHHSRVAHNSSHITILNEADKYHPSAFVPPFPLINSLFSTKQRIT